MKISLVFATALSGCSILALGTVGFSSPAQAATIAGKVNGVWSNPIPDDDNPYCANLSSSTCFISGVGTNTFNWGEVPKSESIQKSNQLTFTGNSFSAKVGSWFEVGTLNYYNGIVYSDTDVKRVTLNLDFAFGDDNQVKRLPVIFNLENTVNEAKNIKDIANADYVKFGTPLPATSFKYNLDSFQVELLGFSPSIFNPQTSIYALEGESANPVSIYAKVTYATEAQGGTPTNNVPEPSTIVGSFLAGMYLVYRQKFSKQKAKSSWG